MNLVALIKPCKKIDTEVKKLKKELFKKIGNQKYLNHFPHTTIFDLKVNKNYIKDDIFKKFLKNKQIIKENFKFIYFYNYFRGKHIFLWKSRIKNEKK